MLSCFSLVQLSETPWTVALQARLSMKFSRQEYWSWLPFPSPGALPDPGIEPLSPALQANSLPPEPLGKPLLSFLAHTITFFKNKANATFLFILQEYILSAKIIFMVHKVQQKQDVSNLCPHRSSFMFFLQ